MNDKPFAPQPNGTIIAIIEETEYELRRPKAGEYRKLREELELIQDEIYEKTIDSKVTRDALNALDVDPNKPPTKETVEEQIDLTVRARKQDRELRAELEEKRSAWMRDVFNTLGTPALEVGDDDLPVWFFQAGTVTDTIEHWQTRPPHLGDR